MAKKPTNVVKMQTKFKLNIGIITFIIIFIYMVIIILKSINNTTYSIYEVENSIIDTNIRTTGLAIRQEKLVNTTDSGYINYYIKDGERVANGSTVYTVDQNGDIHSTLTNLSSDSVDLSDEQYTDIRNRISMFNSYFNPIQYSDVYNFKIDMDNVVLELSTGLLAEQETTMDSATDNANTFKKIAAEESGVVTYYQDGYESFDLYKVTENDFNKDKYTKKTLKSGEIIGAGTSVYKLITSENWNIVIELTPEEVERIRDKETLNINIANNSRNIRCKYELIKNNDVNFAIISLDKMMIDYINERYLDIEIIMDENSGLKIPNSAITTKNVYQLPVSFLTTGSDDTKNSYFNVKTTGEDGTESVKQISPTIYSVGEEYCYVNPDDFDKKDILVANNSKQTLSLTNATISKLEGVLSVNKGIASFKQINTIYSSDDYTIIEPDVEYGINLYDRIILDSSTVEENTVIR